MKATQKILAIAALGVFALATPALASYGGGSNAMPNVMSGVVCATQQPAPQFVFNSRYGGMNGGPVSGAVIGVRNPSTSTTNSADVAKANIPSAGDSGSNAFNGPSSQMICSTLQLNNSLEDR